MTNKYKISDLAKDFNKSSKDIIALVLSLTGEEKKSSTTLGEEEIALVFDAITKANEVKSFKDYFATGEAAREEAKKKRQDAKDKKLAEQMAILEQLKAAAAAAAGEAAPKEEKKPEPKKVEEKKP
ncbi:MAG: translation initiation factor IF-2 N-terminal domain-containing protein, partial [Clostridia bacterium]|nr:translation initiation factor IF-2 N-terminal domain-containing protein [Clostridia bacterium]